MLPPYQPNTRPYHAKPYLYQPKPHLYQRVSCRKFHMKNDPIVLFWGPELLKMMGKGQKSMK